MSEELVGSRRVETHVIETESRITLELEHELLSAPRWRCQLIVTCVRPVDAPELDVVLAASHGVSHSAQIKGAA